jgi:hypothetical protein
MADRQRKQKEYDVKLSGRKIGGLCLVLSAITALAANPPAPPPPAWGKPVAGFVEPVAGEHPRLLFRKADIPALRAKAQTPEGRKMVAHLQQLLGNNGEELPRFDNIFPLNLTLDRTRKGHFTIGHPPGYGLLYTLTGDRKYAAMARTCLERMFNDNLYTNNILAVKNAAGAHWDEKGVKANLVKLGLAGKTDEELKAIPFNYGQGDMDPRLNWSRPGTGMRPGPLLMCVALTYDLCYDAWDEAFRARVAKEMFTYNKPEVFYQKYCRAKNIDLEQLVEGDGYPPSSNHHGYTLGGVGVALLALRHDPGIDMNRVNRLLVRVEANLGKLLKEGHGDRGYFAEGFGCGEISANPTLLTFMQAARVCWGREFVNPSEAAQWLTLKWLMCIVPGPKGEPDYYHVGGSPFYTRNRLDEGHFSNGGEFAHGFGALTDEKQKAALLWVYNSTFGKSERAGTYNVELYPHRMISVLVNWPSDLKPINPAEVIPKAVVDKEHGYYQFRNQWEGPEDFYIAYLNNPDHRHGFVSGAPRGGIFVIRGLGMTYVSDSTYAWNCKPAEFTPYPDGSGVIGFQNKEGQSQGSFAVDYSGRAGVPAVILLAQAWGDGKVDAKTRWMGKFTGTLKNGDAEIRRLWLDNFAGGSLLLIVGKGKLPVPKVEGKTLTLGEQTYTWDGKTLAIGGK